MISSDEEEEVTVVHEASDLGTITNWHLPAAHVAARYRREAEQRAAQQAKESTTPVHLAQCDALCAVGCPVAAQYRQAAEQQAKESTTLVHLAQCDALCAVGCPVAAQYMRTVEWRAKESTKPVHLAQCAAECAVGCPVVVTPTGQTIGSEDAMLWKRVQDWFGSTWGLVKCPACKSVVNPANLKKHLLKVHKALDPSRLRCLCGQPVNINDLKFWGKVKKRRHFLSAAMKDHPNCKKLVLTCPPLVPEKAPTLKAIHRVATEEKQGPRGSWEVSAISQQLQCPECTSEVPLAAALAHMVCRHPASLGPRPCSLCGSVLLPKDLKEHFLEHLQPVAHSTS
jgi:hypothetical protein